MATLNRKLQSSMCTPHRNLGDCMNNNYKKINNQYLIEGTPLHQSIMQERKKYVTLCFKYINVFKKKTI